MQLDSGTSAVIVSLVGFAGIVFTAKIAQKKAETNTPSPPPATVEHVEQAESRIDARVSALETLLAEMIDQLSSTKSFAEAIRNGFLDYIESVKQSWGTTRRPPDLTEDQEALLYNKEPASYNTALTRQALREHNLVTLSDNPPPPSPAPRRPRH